MCCIAGVSYFDFFRLGWCCCKQCYMGVPMNFIAFDLETTGTRPGADLIVEIGAVRFEGNRPLESYSVLVDPGQPIPAEASAVNGITDEMVRGKPSIDAVLGGFADFCGDLPLVAHNAPFDYKFLRAAIEQYRAKAPRGVVFDTLSLARKVFPGLINYRLWTLVRHFEFPGGTFHRAEEDSAYCGRVFARIIETLELRGESADEAALVRMGGKEALYFPQFRAAADQLSLF